jgi:hypothetical protein
MNKVDISYLFLFHNNNILMGFFVFKNKGNRNEKNYVFSWNSSIDDGIF